MGCDYCSCYWVDYFLVHPLVIETVKIFQKSEKKKRLYFDFDSPHPVFSKQESDFALRAELSLNDHLSVNRTFNHTQ